MMNWSMPIIGGLFYICVNRNGRMAYALLEAFMKRVTILPFAIITFIIENGFNFRDRMVKENNSIPFIKTNND